MTSKPLSAEIKSIKYAQNVSKKYKGGKKPNMVLAKLAKSEIRIVGKNLSCRWVDSYLLVWSEEEHPYD